MNVNLYRFKTLNEFENQFGKDDWRCLVPEGWAHSMDKYLGRFFIWDDLTQGPDEKACNIYRYKADPMWRISRQMFIYLGEYHVPSQVAYDATNKSAAIIKSILEVRPYIIPSDYECYSLEDTVWIAPKRNHNPNYTIKTTITTAGDRVIETMREYTRAQVEQCNYVDVLNDAVKEAKEAADKLVKTMKESDMGKKIFSSAYAVAPTLNDMFTDISAHTHTLDMPASFGPYHIVAYVPTKDGRAQAKTYKSFQDWKDSAKVFDELIKTGKSKVTIKSNEEDIKPMTIERVIFNTPGYRTALIEKNSTGYTDAEKEKKLSKVGDYKSTIFIFNNGKKLEIKCDAADEYDPLIGFAIAYVRAIMSQNGRSTENLYKFILGDDKKGLTGDTNIDFIGFCVGYCSLTFGGADRFRDIVDMYIKRQNDYLNK